MRTRITLLTALLLMASLVAAKAGEEVKARGTAWVYRKITSSEVANINAPYCENGVEFQAKGLNLTFTDRENNAVKKEFVQWAEATGQACAGKSRGSADAGPNPEAIAKAEKEMAAQEKMRGGPCGFYYKYWYRDNYLYYELYDADWNLCGSGLLR